MPTVTDRLTEWGLACRKESERLSLPQISQIQVMIDHVRLEDRLHKGVRRRKVTRLTAGGKATKSSRRPMPIINSAVLEVDAIVAKLPDWMRAPLVRRYLYGQPDRFACLELRLSKLEYRQRCNAAIEFVAERLVCNNLSR
jgi:hypothetical protein